VQLADNIKEVLISEAEIQAICKSLGEQISKDYKGKRLLLVSVLKGAVVFLADLMRYIDLDCEIDFMVVSSYGSGTVSTGQVKIIKDLNIDIKDYDLLIVEDILDTGITLSNLMRLLSVREPKSIKICTLLDKPDRRAAEVKADYIGRQIPDEFVVGYGLDYDEKYRNLPFVGILKREVYEK